MSCDPEAKRSRWHPQQRRDVLQALLDNEILVYHPDGMTAFALNETASVIWRLCNGERTVAEIVEMLQTAYPEAAASMSREVDEGVLALLSHGVIRVPRVGASTATYDVGFGGATVRLEADDAAAARILEFLCVPMARPAAGDPSATFRLGAATTPGTMAIYRDDVMLYRGRSESSVATIFLERVLDHLIRTCTSGILLHAAAVARDGQALILAGKTGAGKTTLATWLVCRSFDYLTDELLCLDTQAMSVNGFARPLHLKKPARALFAGVIDRDGGAALMQSPQGAHVSPARLGARVAHSACPRALVLPAYRAGARFDLQPLSKAQAASRLMGCLVNARERPQHGFEDVLGLVQAAPVFAMTYSHLEEAGAQLDAMLGSFH
jgi:coenzyme PQQ synthesis protein D (PqqD)